ncbi:hypothetical protein diail_8730 [Diaporthe ilicicola]|nr:hypothetical protein diail_8730 [Diaporthe ilicicola]
MSEANIQLIEELLQEQNLEPEDVFCSEGGCFQVIDIRNGKIHKTIISISGQSTICNLDISPGWAAKLFEAYKVNAEFSRTLVSFGNGPHFAEACDGNDLLCTRSNGTCEQLAVKRAGPQADQVKLDTLSYKLNYVEPNDRNVSERWSSRHLGVYHEHEVDFDLYILVHCSRSSALYSMCSSASGSRPGSQNALKDIAQNPERLHDLILQTYVHHWRPYLRSWGNEVSKMVSSTQLVDHRCSIHLSSVQSNQAMVSKVAEAGTQSYVWLRRLRSLRDRVDLASGHCMSNLVVIQSINQSRQTKTESQDHRRLSSVEGTINSCIKNSQLLKDRIDNTIELISCTLKIHSHEEAAKLVHEIKVLTEETSSVTKKLTQIAESSAHSGEIIRVITIVSAIYLPGSFATSVFGMNFFDFVEGKGRIAIAKDIYIFVAFWIGLTLLTGATFFWAYMRGRKKLKRIEESALQAISLNSTKVVNATLSFNSGYDKSGAA